MKKYYFSVLIFLSSLSIANAQFVNFSDVVFKDRLLAADENSDVAFDANFNRIRIDTNNNGEIEFSEAESVFGLNVVTNLGAPWPAYINSLVGVEAFVNLNFLNCETNNITFIDVTAMPNLKVLYCSENPINFINATGIELESLRAKDCGLTSLAAISFDGSQLLEMELDGNDFGTISLSNFPQLGSLGLSSCDLTSVNLTNLPSLERLDLYNNQLTSVNVTGLPNLKWFYCYSNAITDIDVSQNSLLQILSIFSNQLATLDVSHNSDLFGLGVNDNNLTWLNIKNGANESNLNVQNNPDLANICADESQIANPQLLTNAITQVNSYCSFVPGGNYFTVAGSSTFDNESDGCDASDVAIPNVKFLVSDGGATRTFICNNTGNYSMALTAGDYTVTPTIENQAYFSFSPSVVSFSFPDSASPLAQNFCITPNGTHPDLEIAVMALNPSRPGFNTYLKIIYKNKGNMTQSGIIVFAFDDSIFDFSSSDPSVASQALGQLTWNFDNLAPFEVREINLTLNLNSPTDVPPVNGGHILNYTGQILTDDDDDTPADNTCTLVQTVVNSLDPNDKTCLEGHTVTPDTIGKYVHYLIRFENTGTAAAEDIVVADAIDTDKFDVASLNPLDGSHAFYTRIDGNKVEFIFENINLPFDDANNDGYVLFKIKTKPTLIVGDAFSNSASIYFDYNHPIVTEPAVTTIAVLAAKDFEFSDEFVLYPNPAGETILIQGKGNLAMESAQVYNTLGQLVLAIPNAHPSQPIDVTRLKTGHYFLKIRTDKGVSSVKFLKK